MTPVDSAFVKWKQHLVSFLLLPEVVSAMTLSKSSIDDEGARRRAKTLNGS